MKNCVPDVGIVPSSISKIGTLAHAAVGADAPTRALTASWATYDLTSL